MIYVVGHKNPDTDSICSAIALAYFLDSTPAKLGNLNQETSFVLTKFNFEEPITLTKAKGSQIYLVDHSEKFQTLDDLEEGTLIGIIDHHKIGISTSSPIVYISKPVGSTASIIAELYFRKSLDYIGARNKDLLPNLAGILLSAILSDTVLFKSPTTTKLDKELAIELAKIAKIENLYEYGMEMLKAKSSIINLPATNIFNTDYKEFCMNGSKVGISQVEVVDPSELEDKKDEIFHLMKKEFDVKNLTLILFVITDIMKEGSEVLVYGNKEHFESAFAVKLKDNSIFIPGMMSRKKQIVPVLEKIYLNCHL
jgi:manganese-dependent inorganic pyrophosphatase